MIKNLRTNYILFLLAFVISASMIRVSCMGSELSEDNSVGKNQIISEFLGDFIDEDDDIRQEVLGVSDNKIRCAGIDYENSVYSGKAVTFDIRVYCGNKLLREGADYNILYKYNVNACTDITKEKAPRVIVKGKGEYRGKIKEEYRFKINPLDIAVGRVSNDVAFVGTKNLMVVPKLFVGGKRLRAISDYSIDYGIKEGKMSELPAGNYEITLEGVRNYCGNIKSTLTMVEREDKRIPLSKVSIIGGTKRLSYTGDSLSQNSISLAYKENPLVEGRDYNVKYLNNKEVGKACMVFSAISGSGFYGEKIYDFAITGKSISGTKMSYEKNCIYNASMIKPPLNVTTKSGEPLIEGKDYTVEYRKNVNCGKALIIIKGKGLYYGTAKRYFSIKPIALNDENKINVRLITPEDCDAGEKLTPIVEVLFGTKELLKDKDYKVSYKNIKKLGQTTIEVTVKGKGNFNKSLRLLYTPVFNDTYIFVSPSGDDNADGSIEHPLKTVQEAINRVRPGESIILRGGKYEGNNTFNRSGTKDGYITIMSYANEKAIITTKTGVDGAAFAMNGNQYIKIRNIAISDLKSRSVYGILMSGGEEYIYIEGCDFNNIVTTKPGSSDDADGEANAILLFGERADKSINHIYITNNTVHNNVNGWSENISIAGNCEYIYVNNNKVYNNTNIGIDFYGNAQYCKNKKFDQPRHCECRGNIVYNCKSFYAENAGIYVDGAYDILISDNEVYKNAYGIEVGSEEWRKEYDENNRVREIIVDNNSIHDNTDCGIRIGGWTNDASTGVVSDCNIKNNTFKKNGDDSEIVLSKCDNIRFNNNVFDKNRSYEDVVVFDEEIDASQITNIYYDGKKVR